MNSDLDNVEHLDSRLYSYVSFFVDRHLGFYTSLAHILSCELILNVKYIKYVSLFNKEYISLLLDGFLICLKTSNILL